MHEVGMVTLSGMQTKQLFITICVCGAELGERIENVHCEHSCLHEWHLTPASWAWVQSAVLLS